MIHMIVLGDRVRPSYGIISESGKDFYWVQGDIEDFLRNSASCGILVTRCPLSILCLQTLIAEGKIDHNHVRLDYVESPGAKPMTAILDECGRYGDWPGDAVMQKEVEMENRYLGAVEGRRYRSKEDGSF